VIISRYLTRAVFRATSAITIVLLLAFLSQQLVRYLNYVAVGKIPTGILLQLVGFEVPYLLAMLLPLGLYLGILLAYGRLYTDNEMAILQLSGIGERKLLQMTLFITSLFTIFIMYLMLWLNPWVAAKRQQLMASDEATLHMIQTLIPGRFQASPDGKHVMYVEQLTRDHARARDVFLASTAANDNSANGNSPWMVVFANEGYQVKDATTKDQFFVTRKGHRYEGVPGQNDYRITQFKKYEIRIPQTEVRIAHEEDEAISSLNLWHDYQNPTRAAELQWRLSIGINAFLLALLAVPLSSRQPRKSRYLTIFPAILFYILYFNILLVAKHWVEQGKVSITIGIWWVHGIVVALIIILYLFTLLRSHIYFKR
jgi:lipopolysaccharide export system permease protein